MAEPGRTRRGFLGALAAASLGGAAGCTAPIGTQPTDASPETSPNPDGTSPYTQVYREVVDSVVLVGTVGPGGGGQGSGFVFDEAGHVLTNEHVVAGAQSVDLRFSGGEWRDAELLGTDVYTDLAVLSAPGRPSYATELSFVDSPPPIGAEVVAIGSPFGLEKSLSTGVVSGIGRSIPTEGGYTIPDAVQTDAAVNPGNSGGPLVTLDGEAVGVIRSGGGDNIGFAVSAALARRVAPALIDRGRYRHSYMGVTILDVSPVVAEANDLDGVSGVLVERVLDGGPADGVLRDSEDVTTVGGVQVPVGGDVVIGMGGESIPSSGALGRYLALETRPGEAVPVRVLRDGSERTLELTLGVRPRP